MTRATLIVMTIAEPDRDALLWAASAGPVGAQIRSAILRLAECECPVLLLGEHGSGKRFTAARIHMHSERSHSSYAEMSCNATNSQSILTALANEGTLYLSEVAELDPSLQDILLREYFLSDKPQACRLLFGSTYELSAEVGSQKMREDFYYQISAITLRIPPLRHRRPETLAIANAMLTEYSRRFDRPRPEISGDLATYLLEHTWPENLIELQTTVKTLVAIGDESISLAALRAATPTAKWDKSHSLKEATRSVSIQVERQMISEVLGVTGGNRKRAADRLGISYKALLYKIKQLGVENHSHSRHSGATI